MSNRTLAMDILRRQKKATFFWFLAFVLTLTAAVAAYLGRKDGERK